jgi:hypothetical protein
MVPALQILGIRPLGTSPPTGRFEAQLEVRAVATFL